MKKMLMIIFLLALICPKAFAATTQQKLGSELQELVRCLDGKTESLKTLTMSMNKEGNHEIKASIKPSVLLQFPKLMEKFGIKNGSPEAEELLKKQYVNFVVDVASGKYRFDDSLGSSRYIH